MKATNGDLVFSIKPVVGAVFNGCSTSKRLRLTPRSKPSLRISYGPHIATAFFASTASLIVSARAKFRPGDIGHLLFSEEAGCPGRQKRTDEDC